MRGTPHFPLMDTRTYCQERSRQAARSCSELFVTGFARINLDPGGAQRDFLEEPAREEGQCCHRQYADKDVVQRVGIRLHRTSPC